MSDLERLLPLMTLAVTILIACDGDDADADAGAGSNANGLAVIDSLLSRLTDAAGAGDDAAQGADCVPACESLVACVVELCGFARPDAAERCQMVCSAADDGIETFPDCSAVQDVMQGGDLSLEAACTVGAPCEDDGDCGELLRCVGPRGCQPGELRRSSSKSPTTALGGAQGSAGE